MELYPGEEEQTPEEQPLYTADDLTPKDTTTGNYSILKSLSSYATGTPAPDDVIDFNGYVNDTWKAIAPEQNAVDMQTAYDAAGKNQPAIAQQMMEQVRARNQLIGSQTEQTQLEVRAKLHDIAMNAVETNAVTTQSILINNTPQRVAQVTQQTATKIAGAASLEKKLEDATTFGSIAKGLAFEFTPFSMEQGAAIDRVAVTRGVDADSVSRATGRNDTINRLQVVYQSLDPEKKEEWLSGLFTDLTDSAIITKLQAAHVVMSVAKGDEMAVGSWSDWFDRLGVAGFVLAGAGAVYKIGRIGKTISAVNDMQRTMAAGGAKGLLETAEQTKVISAVTNNMRLRQVGVAVGELTGVSAALDLAKLITVNALKVLPDSIGTSASTIMKPIRNDINKLINGLQDTVAAKGIRAEEAAIEVRRIEQTFSKAHDAHIHSVDPITMSENGTVLSTKVVYKPLDGSAFLTKEAAEQFMTSRGGQNMRVVPDTTNTKFLVEESVKTDLKARRITLEAELLGAVEAETIAAKAKPKGGAGTGKLPDPPIVLLAGKPRYKMNTLSFESNIDKAAYQVGSKTALSKSDEAVKRWLQNSTGWDDNVIAAHAATLRKYITSIENTADDVGNIAVGKQYGGPTSRSIIDMPQYSAAFDSMVSGPTLTRVGNLYLGEGVESKYITAFVGRLGKALGMEDRPVLVLQLEDALKSKNTDIADLAKVTKENHPTAGAVHYDYSAGKSVIVMSKKVGSHNSIQRYMDTFAHEYGHAFEAEFSAKYFGIINASFNKWLHAKGIKYKGQGVNKVISDMFPPEAMVEYRNISTAEVLKGWINNWANGDVAGYKAMEEIDHTWLTSHAEFFAENFSKWAFTDDVPTDILGQAFKRLVDGFKLIVEAVNDVMRGHGFKGFDSGVADKNITAMLNAHIKLLEEAGPKASATISAASRDLKKTRSLKHIQKDLDAVNDELKAIADAEGGLKTGWLVEHNVNKAITYENISKYADDDINSVARWAMNDWAFTTSSELYGQRVLGIKQESHYRGLMADFMGNSISKLSKSERAALDSTLVLGDKEGKVFSDVELTGQGLSLNTRDAYHRVRALRDVMHQVRNDTAAKSMTRRGFVEITEGFKAEDGGKVFGRPVTPEDGKYIYLADAGKNVRMGDGFRKDMVKNGYVIYEMPNPIEVDGKLRKTIAIKNTDLQFKTVTDVIPYRTGEYRRMYSDDYFVKIKSINEVDGVAEEIISTHRTATSNKEAQAYADALTEAQRLFKAGKLSPADASRLMESFGWKPEDLIAAFTDGRFPPEFKVNILFNRTEDDYVREAVGLSTNYSSKRGDRVFSVHGEDAVNTLSPIDSVSAEIGNTAYVASVTEWRESHIQRWFNTFRDDLPANVQIMDPQHAFLYMLNNKGFYMRDNKRMLFAENVQDYIISQLNIPTKEERVTQGFAVRMSEMFENSALGKIPFLGPMAVAKMRSTKNPANFARSVAFHSFFAFNPVQFVMQSINAFNAVAIHPIHGANALKKSLWYGAALMSDQEEIWRTMAKANNITSLGFSDVEEFVTAVRVMKRSGLFSDLAGTSLVGASKTATNVTSGTKKMAINASSLFFNMGEGNARLISFEIARKVWMEKNVGKAWWADDAIGAILKHQDDITQNMTRANTAAWQKGVWSIPFHFTQYPIKFAINVFQGVMGNKRAFTKKQLAMLMVMHSVFFGTEGNLMPFRDEVNEFLDKQDFDPQTRLAIQQGVASAAIAWITNDDLKIATGTRFNTTRYYEDLYDGIFDPEKKFLEVAGGPAGFVLSRVVTNTTKGISIMIKSPMSLDTLRIGTTEMFKSFSFMNNAQKSILARQNYNIVTSKSGADLYRVTDYETWAIGMGFPPVAASDANILYRSLKQHKDDLKSAGETIGYHANLALVALENKDEESYKVHSAVVQVVLGAHSGTDYSNLLNAASKTVGFTKYKKMLVEHALNDWQINGLVVDKEGN